MNPQHHSHRFRRSSVAFSLLLALAVSCVLAPISAHAGEFYRFERMWPTLQQPWYFTTLSGVAIDLAGNVYLADRYNNRIRKFTPDGHFITEWGGAGSGDGQFQDPRSVAVGGTHLYVADLGNNRIQQFTVAGTFVAKWNREGSGDGEFRDPIGVAVDGNGNVYVCDSFNYRVQKFTSQGKFLAKWGGMGSGDGQFGENWSSSERGPRAIAAAPDGSIYVTDPANSRVQKFTADGEFLTKWGQKGCEAEMADGTLCGPYGIAVDSGQNVYVTDYANHRVQKFTADGQFLTKWGGCCAGGEDGLFYLPQGVAVDATGTVFVGDAAEQLQKFTNDGRFITAWHSWGSGKGQFSGPWAVAIGPSGDVYVGDYFNQRVQRFSADGRFRKEWGGIGLTYSIAADADGYVYVGVSEALHKFTPDGDPVWVIGDGDGTGDGEFREVRGVTVGKDGYIYTTDGECGGEHGDGSHTECRIQKFTSDGQFVKKWGILGSEDGQFGDVQGITADTAGNLFVADHYYSTIQKFTSDGQFLRKWKSENGPKGLVADSGGNVYVANRDNSRVQKYDGEGNFLAWLGGLGSSPGQMSSPNGVAVSQDGRVYVADSGNNRLAVFRPVAHESNSRAIIVAGGGPYDGNLLWPATEMCANFAYRSLSYQGFAKERLRYFSADTGLDLDSNGLADDVAGTPTRENLEQAITAWAAGSDDVILYLTDHGGRGTFRLSGQEVFSAADLNPWLDALEQSIKGRLIVVYDACESGSFLPYLASSSGKRVVITSTSSGDEAYFINSGSVSFSNFFWTHVFNGLDVFHAFSLANKAMRFTTDTQHPLLDGNGNGKGNQAADYEAVRGVFMGNGTGSFNKAPTIKSVSPAQVINGTDNALLYAQGVTDPDGVARVWATIRPPNITPPAGGNAVSVLPTLELTWKEGTMRYEGTYTGFTTSGVWQAALYAMDRIGNISAPKLTTVTVDAALTRKAMIVAGSSPQEVLWPAIERSVSAAYEALLSQGYTDDTVTFLSPVAITGVDQLATLDNLEYALVSWAGQSTQDLVLYLVGDGGAGTFQLNAGETLSADALGTWLDDLQTGMNGKVTVVYDAPQSGTFLPVLAPPEGLERIVIASTGAQGPACFAAGGEVAFSRFFWNEVAKGANVRESFLQAKKSIGFACPKQTAGLDDNGNGKANEPLDGALARQVTIGSGIVVAADPPVIGSVSPPRTLTGSSSATIWANQVTTTGTIRKVWAVITPPGATGSRAITDLPTLALSKKKSGRYQAAYTGFSASGTYRITIYASDKKGNTSLPKTTRVRQADSSTLK